ncbi:MAG: sulfotransferase [Elainellaceae cyanobacterium]
MSSPLAPAKSDWNPRLLHPLMGADLVTLARVLVANGGVAPRCLPHAAVAIATALARLPFTAIEQFRLDQLRRQYQEQLAQEQLTHAARPPIFIVGHWRSGTTFLYEILCRSSQFSYVSPFAVGLPWDFLTLTQWFGHWLERSLPADRFIDSMQVNPDSPQEDEIGLASMQSVSFYHGLYFPKHLKSNFDAGIFFDHCTPAQVDTWQRVTQYFFEKVQLQHPGKTLLIKNPVYTARVAMLRHMFPDAKFVHIYRNPYVVYQSTRNFYRKLFRELALQPFDLAVVEDLILESYPRMMDAVQHDSRQLASNQFFEIQFEAFEQDPIGHIQTLYERLELDGFDAAQPKFQDYLSANQRYQKNRYVFSPEDADRVYQHWGRFIDQWKYRCP